MYLTTASLPYTYSSMRSIIALFAGFALTVALSLLTDFVLLKTGVMKQPFDQNTDSFIIIVIAYRAIYEILGCYLIARLAPSKPLRLAMIGGLIGFLVSIMGAIAMWDTPPHWYPISLIVLALPCAWIGGKLYARGHT